MGNILQHTQAASPRENRVSGKDDGESFYRLSTLVALTLAHGFRRWCATIHVHTRSMFYKRRLIRDIVKFFFFVFQLRDIVEDIC